MRDSFQYSNFRVTFDNGRVSNFRIGYMVTRAAAQVAYEYKDLASGIVYRCIHRTDNQDLLVPEDCSIPNEYEGLRIIEHEPPLPAPNPNLID